jgi:pseudouridylate synthase
VPARVQSASEAARIAEAHWELEGGGLLLARPPDDSLEDVEPLIDEALEAAARNGATGQAVTPFVLTYLHEQSAGKTLAANRDLVVANAALAAEVAVSHTPAPR